MRRLLIAGLSVMLAACTAKSDQRTSIQDFVPPGWKVIQADIGDLDKDGANDTVLVIEQDNPVNRKQNDGMGERVLNLNPRHLIVLLKTPSGYHKAVEATHFLPSQNSADTPCLTDPMDYAGEDSIQIERGTLKISLQDWFSCGSWDSSNYEFKFRYDNGRFRLIGFDQSTHMRNSGDATSYSTNFLTGKKKVVTENVFDPDVPIESNWERLAGHREFYLDETNSKCQMDKKGHDWCK